MKVGFLVDGRAEFASLPLLYPQIRGTSNLVLMKPLYADMQPYAPIGQIVTACRAGVAQLEGRGVDRIVVLLDRENRSECPGAIAEPLQNGLRSHVRVELKVVLKDRKFENWLVADPDALRAQPGRFELSGGDVARVVPNKADQCEALAILSRCVRGNYDKVQDAKRILTRMDLGRACANSRSLRKLIRSLEFSPPAGPVTPGIPQT